MPIKYLALIALVILVGLSIHFFPDNIIPVSMIFAWVFFVAAIFAVGEDHGCWQELERSSRHASNTATSPLS